MSRFKGERTDDGEGNPSLHLRKCFLDRWRVLWIEDGFSFDDDEEDDTEIVKDGVKVVVDGMSYQYLAGSTVDYSESLTGSQFVVENPNASYQAAVAARVSVYNVGNTKEWATPATRPSDRASFQRIR